MADAGVVWERGLGGGPGHSAGRTEEWLWSVEGEEGGRLEEMARVCWPWPRDRIWSKKPPGPNRKLAPAWVRLQENSAGGAGRGRCVYADDTYVNGYVIGFEYF